MMKLCKDCKYFYSGYMMPYCKNPKYGIDPVNGEVKAQLASLARSEGVGNSFSCGPEGKWFEPAPDNNVEVKKRRSLLEWFKDIGK